jgi:predicted glutamine amidotransferase
MCQLLGMNCNVPTDICFSFTGFQARGGLTDVHRDGWGIAFFEDRGVRQFLDHQPSAVSPIAALVRDYPIKSKNVIAHIRKATQGKVALENTHPFQRELWGRYWIFAHNGHVSNFAPHLDGSFRPVGQTDSERAFCWILQRLHRHFGECCPSQEAFFAYLAELTKEAGSHGAFNFLLSNGDTLIAHCSTRLSYVIRRAPFPTPQLKDCDVRVDFNHHTQSNDRVAIVATQPLTSDETWTTIDPGTLCLFREGEIVAQVPTVAGPENCVSQS